MDRSTRAAIVSTFTFKKEEISHLGLESQQWDFMEEKARKELKENGHDWEGGKVDVYFGYAFDDTVMTIIT